MSQLVFEHALKMRVKAEPSPTKTSSTKDEGKESTHLTGKMTNLMTADLNDLIDGRDFPLILVYFPIQVVGCTWFLYKILGWRFVPREIPVFEPLLISSVRQRHCRNDGHRCAIPRPQISGCKVTNSPERENEEGKLLSASDFSSYAIDRWGPYTDGCSCSGCHGGYECHQDGKNIWVGEQNGRPGFQPP